MFEQINELSILVVAILGVAIGTIWYSPLLFGQLLVRSNGDRTDHVLSKKVMVIKTIQSVVVQILFFTTLAHFLSFINNGDVSFRTLGILLFVLVVSHTALLAIRDERSFTYFLIHAGYSATLIFGGLGVIAFWPW